MILQQHEQGYNNSWCMSRRTQSVTRALLLVVGARAPKDMPGATYAGHLSGLISARSAFLS